MKKILIWIFALCFCGLACAEPTSEPQSSPMPDGFRAILYENEPFYHAQAEEHLTLAQIGERLYDESVVFPRYALADVDRDGMEELVLAQSVNGDEWYGFLVLDQADGGVYGYEFVYRAMLALKADGTFSFSSGAADHGFGYAHFDGEATLIPLAESTSDGETIYYFMETERISQQAFDALLHKQALKKDAEWFALTPSA